MIHKIAVERYEAHTIAEIVKRRDAASFDLERQLMSGPLKARDRARLEALLRDLTDSRFERLFRAVDGRAQAT